MPKCPNASKIYHFKGYSKVISSPVKTSTKTINCAHILTLDKVMKTPRHTRLVGAGDSPGQYQNWTLN